MSDGDTVPRPTIEELEKMLASGEPLKIQLQPDGSIRAVENKVEAALEKWMCEVTALLCYQPEVPMAHKFDLSNAMQDYRVASGRTPKPTEEQPK